MGGVLHNPARSGVWGKVAAFVLYCVATGLLVLPALEQLGMLS
ncbi:hypothetical protein [Amantichitinum ursilacus]|uniref:Uncharacterized protein n=1 Tax=Amantichitinum ursilacus TaxID=857265 RepID=A0A0N1JTJ7_9NEIS|nr:hypothetical protein [Amantichitinum ursilacus]KPC54995.1 hypothetical protein WG78_00010 [Amantichitinum ursilacus]